MAKFPNLSLSSGPSSAGAEGRSNGQTSTGAFYFKQKRQDWQDVLKGAVPLLIGGAILWLVVRKIK